MEFPKTPMQLNHLADQLRKYSLRSPLTFDQVLDGFGAWDEALQDRGLSDIEGLTFLRLWLRRNNLEEVLNQELGDWKNPESGRLWRPVGLVGHWPAANVAIQPFLSATCALVSLNQSLVRVPSDLTETTRRIQNAILSRNSSDPLLAHIGFVSFSHQDSGLMEAMARSVDAALIWGGEEAVTKVRNLPFRHWVRTQVFGPRLSIAMIAGDSWQNEEVQTSIAKRLAREVWQFDQQACSSPQTLFIERGGGTIKNIVDFIRQAFETENRLHPRREIEPRAASDIATARAQWLLSSSERRAFFPESPDWTILVGREKTVPPPTQWRVLTILEVERLEDVLASLDGNIQTIGLQTEDIEREKKLISMAADRGIDRIVKLGHMHLFSSPWDGKELVRPLLRSVRTLNTSNLKG